MKSVSKFFCAPLLLLVSTLIVAGQQLKMDGYLRVTEQVDPVTQATLDRRYYVEVYADKKYKADTPPVATLLVDGDPVSETVEAFRDDPIRFRMLLPANADPTKTLNVFVRSYQVPGERSYGKLIAVKGDAARVIVTDSRCRSGFGMTINYGAPRTGSDSKESIRYKEDRVGRVYDWIQRPTTPAETDKILVEAEQLNRLGKKDFHVRQVTMNVSSRKKAVEGQIVEVCFDVAGALPIEKYDARVSFNVPSGPFETLAPLSQLGVAGAPAQASPKAEINNQDVGVRPIERNLDLGLAFTSALEKVQRSGKSVLERKNRGVLDLRFAPLKDLISIKIAEAPLSADKPQPTRARVNLFTPFYVDARVSTGRIEDNTLSLNRVVLGVMDELRFYRSIGVNNETYYSLVFRGANASDRDFKQVEGKAAIEFRPVWALLNHPLIDNVKTEGRIIFPGEKPPLKKILGATGYEVKPLVGFEFGRTYRRHRPAPAVKPSDAVRRLYVGMNISLTPLRFLTMTVSDTFFFRFESKTDRYHNYFKGGLEFPIGGPTNFDRPAQTLFLQYENGGQPPFATPDVKTFKFGYRIQWDRWLYSLR